MYIIRSNNDRFNNVNSTLTHRHHLNLEISLLSTMSTRLIITISKKHRSQWYWSTLMKSISIRGRLNIDETISKRLLTSTSKQGRINIDKTISKRVMISTSIRPWISIESSISTHARPVNIDQRSISGRQLCGNLGNLM